MHYYIIGRAFMYMQEHYYTIGRTFMYMQDRVGFRISIQQLLY